MNRLQQTYRGSILSTALPSRCPALLCCLLHPLQRRRSYNCGTGDFIVQPLATTEVMR